MLDFALISQLRPVLLVLLFVAIVAIVYGVTEMIARTSRVRSRLDIVSEAGSAVQGGGQSLRNERNNSEWKKLVDRIEKLGISLAVDRGGLSFARGPEDIHIRAAGDDARAARGAGADVAEQA